MNRDTTRRIEQRIMADVTQRPLRLRNPTSSEINAIIQEEMGGAAPLGGPSLGSAAAPVGAAALGRPKPQPQGLPVDAAPSELTTPFQESAVGAAPLAGARTPSLGTAAAPINSWRQSWRLGPDTSANYFGLGPPPSGLLPQVRWQAQLGKQYALDALAAPSRANDIAIMEYFRDMRRRNAWARR